MDRLASILRWKTLRRVGIVFVVLIILALVALRGLALTSFGRSFVEQRIEQISVRGQMITLEGLHGDLLGRFQINELSVSDVEGVWLYAEDIDIRWHPLALLNGRYHVESALVRHLDIQRRPELKEPDPPKSDGPSSPPRLNLDHIAFGRIALAEGIAGPKGDYAAKASLTWGMNSDHASISLTPYDKMGDRANIDLRWGDGSPLIGYAELEGEAGGLIASVIGVNAEDKVTGELLAERSYEQWRLSASMEIGEADFLSVSGREADGELTLEGEANLSRLPAYETLSERLGGPLSFSVVLNTAQRSDAPSYLFWESPNIEVEATGRLAQQDPDLTISELRLSARLNGSEALSGVGSLSIPDLTAIGSAHYSDGVYVFDGNIRVPQIDLEEKSAEEILIDGMISYSDSIVDLDTDIVVSSITDVPQAAAAYLQWPVQGSLEGKYRIKRKRLDAERYAIQAGSTRLRGAGSFDFDGPIALAGRFNTSDIDTTLSSAALRWSVDGTYKGALSGSLEGDVTFRPPDGDASFPIGQSASLVLQAQRDEDGGITIPRGFLATETLVIEGSAQTLEGEIEGSADIGLSSGDLGPFTYPPINGRLSVSGPIDLPRYALDLSSDWIRAYGLSLEDARLEIYAVGNTLSEADLRLNGHSHALPVLLQAAAQFKNNTLTLPRLQLDFGDLSISGSASGPVKDPLAGQAIISANGLLPNTGPITGDLHITGRTIESQLSVQDYQSERFTLNALEFELSGPLSRPQSRIESQGQLELLGLTSSFDLVQEGTVNIPDQEMAFSFNSEIGGLNIHTTEPAKIGFGDRMGIDVHLLAAGGTLDLRHGRYLADNQAHLSFSDLNLGPFTRLLGRDSLDGQLSGALSFQTLSPLVTGEGNIQLTDFKDRYASSDAVNLTLTPKMTRTQLSIALETHDTTDGLSLSSFLTLPILQNRNTRLPQLNQYEPAALKISAKGPINSIATLLAPADLRIEGDVLMDLHAEGALESLRPIGTIKLSSGLIEDDASGVWLNEVTIDTVLSDSMIDIQHAEAAGGIGGSVTALGQLAYDGSAQIDIALDRLNALKRDDIKATMSGNLGLSRTSNGALLNGTLALENARINTSQISQGGYTQLSVELDDPKKPTEKAATTENPLYLDISVLADDRVFVSGSGIESEWSVDAKLSGTRRNPSLFGSAELVRGDVDFIGRRFRLTQGRINVSGELDQARISTEARREIGGVVTYVTATGPILSPAVAFYSEPALPQDQILAWAVFGKPISELSAFEATQLAYAATQLSGGGLGTAELLSPIRDAFGVDSFDISVESDGGASITAGKYIAEDVFLNLEGNGSGVPGLSVEWTPLSNLSIEAKLGTQNDSHLDIQWIKEFDLTDSDSPD